MMPQRVETPPRAWYRKFTVCSRRQKYTTITCFVFLTLCFTYFTFNKDGWKVTFVPDQTIPNKDALTLGDANNEEETSSAVDSNVQNGGFRDSPTKSIFLSTYAVKHDALANSGPTVLSGSNPAGIVTRSRFPISTSPKKTNFQLSDPSLKTIPDRNSIKGSVSSSKHVDNEFVKYSDEDYSDYYSIPNDYPKERNTLSKVRASTVLPDSSDSESYPSDSHKLSTSEKTDQAIGGTTTLSPNSTTYQNATQPYSEPLDYDSESQVSSWQSELRGEGEPNRISPERDQISYTPQEVDIMSLKQLQFLESYKNPCWEETTNTWYMDNVYLDVENVRAVLTRMSAVLRLRQEKGDDHRVRCLPYFFIIGQPKCGSTDLYEKLMAHPEAVRPPTKEPHWWTRTRLGRHRAYGHVVTLADYIDLFDFAAYSIEQHPVVSPDTGDVFHKMVTGEGSMSTFWDNDQWWAMVGNENLTEPRFVNPDYIHHLLPDTKLILILRNPTTRMYSDYLYFRKRMKLPVDFHDDVVNAIQVYENCSKGASWRSCVYNGTVSSTAKIRLRVGLYAVFMDDWLRVFRREQFFIVRTEDYANNPREVLRGLFRFLGLSELSESHEDRILARKKANTRRKEDQALGDMLPETRIILNEFYRPFNRQLATLLKDDKFLWADT